MSDFVNRSASQLRLAVSRFGEAFEVHGQRVTAIYDARFNRVNFGDERYKNVDMTGVYMTSGSPAITLPESSLPFGVARGSDVLRLTPGEKYTVLSIERDNGVAVVRLKREAN